MGIKLTDQNKVRALNSRVICSRVTFPKLFFPSYFCLRLLFLVWRHFYWIIISRGCQLNKFEPKLQSNQSNQWNVIERNQINLVPLSSAIESQLNGLFLGNIWLCSIGSIDSRLCSIDLMIVNYLRLIFYQVSSIVILFQFCLVVLTIET